MNRSDVRCIINILTELADAMEVDTYLLVNALIGVCWSEKEANQIKTELTNK